MPDAIRVLVAHNISDDDRKWLNGYKSEHEVQIVFEFEALENELFSDDDKGDRAVCEQAFHLFNAPAEYLTPLESEVTSQYRRLGLRSLSVGDVVFIQRGTGLRAYACDAVGWTKLDNEPRLIPAVTS